MEIDYETVNWSISWSKRVTAMLGDARIVSCALGHWEVICVCDLIATMLYAHRPLSLKGSRPLWADLVRASNHIYPPFGKEEERTVVLSPGGQTPKVKQILRRAMILAERMVPKQVSLEFVWLATVDLEFDCLTQFKSHLTLSSAAAVGHCSIPQIAGEANSSELPAGSRK